MRFVVDANVLFTFFWNGSVFSRTCQFKEQKALMWFAPHLAIREILKYEREIQKKAGIPKQEFDDRLTALHQRVSFLDAGIYQTLIQVISDAGGSLPENEHEELMDGADFLALAHHLRCPLWSNDALLKKQAAVKVLSTREIILLLG